jgi:hypothetical protein
MGGLTLTTAFVSHILPREWFGFVDCWLKRFTRLRHSLIKLATHTEFTSYLLHEPQKFDQAKASLLYLVWSYCFSFHKYNRNK